MNINNDLKHKKSVSTPMTHTVSIGKSLNTLIIGVGLLAAILFFTPKLIAYREMRLDKAPDTFNYDFIMVPLIIVLLSVIMLVHVLRKRSRYVIGRVYGNKEMLELAKVIESSGQSFDEAIVKKLKTATLQYKDLKKLKRILKDVA